MPQTSGLTIRQFERQVIELSAELEIAADHRAQIAFSSTSGMTSVHQIECHTLDISPGGAGLSAKNFLPRGTRGRLRIFDPRSSVHQIDGTQIHCVLFEHEVKLRRVALTGHEPTYFLGVSFENHAPGFEAMIVKFLDHIEQAYTAADQQEDIDRA